MLRPQQPHAAADGRRCVEAEHVVLQPRHRVERRARRHVERARVDDEGVDVPNEEAENHAAADRA
eukprot:6288454-Prymnesium_polylepis.1